MRKEAALATFRKSNPAFANLADDELVVLLHDAFYRDMDIVELERLVSPPSEPPAIPKDDPLGIRTSESPNAKEHVALGSYEFLLIDNEATLNMGQALIDRGFTDDEWPSERMFEYITLIAGHAGLLAARFGRPELIDELTHEGWDEVFSAATGSRDEILAAKAGGAN
ncbi:MAG: hypothetical protein AAGD43_03290 [Pseudomonadota bacterium]